MITFEELWRAKAYAEEFELPWPLLLDPDHSVYNDFGMLTGTNTQVMGVKNWWTYMKLMVRRKELPRPTGDLHQLGGDVLVDPEGIIRFHFVSHTPIDRPSIDELKRAVTEASND